MEYTKSIPKASQFSFRPKSASGTGPHQTEQPSSAACGARKLYGVTLSLAVMHA
jgi:hypothetical protein